MTACESLRVAGAARSEFGYEMIVEDSKPLRLGVFASRGLPGGSSSEITVWRWRSRPPPAAAHCRCFSEAESHNPGDIDELHAVYLGQRALLPIRIRVFLHIRIGEAQPSKDACYTRERLVSSINH